MHGAAPPAWRTPWPPWRGPVQLLHIGPWGVAIDAMLATLRTARVLHFDADSVDSVPRVLPLRALPCCAPGKRRVVIISDTHGKHRCLRVPPADVLVHCGDVLQRYGYPGGLGAARRGLADFDTWLGAQSQVRHKLVIGGNHDLSWQHGSWCPQNAVCLSDGCRVEVAGLSFFGSPHSPPGVTSNDAFQAKAIGKEHSSRALAAIEGGSRLDVLVTHSKSAAFERVAVASRVWAHGHFHDQYGIMRPQRPQRPQQQRGCTLVNAASCDMIYRPVNPPVVMDITPASAGGAAPSGQCDRAQPKREI